MSDQGGPTEANWLPDPHGRHEYRYWDGTAWSDQVSDGGVVSTDPPGDAPTVATDAVAGAGTAPQPVAGPPTEGAPVGPPGTGVPYVPPTEEGKNKLPIGLIALVGLGVAAVVAALVIFLGGGDDGGSEDAASSDDLSASDLSDLSDLSDFSVPDFSDFSVPDFSDFSDFSFDFSDDFSFDLPSDLVLGSPEDPSTFIPDYGSDARFTQLADSCFGGDLADCDELYRITPIDASTNSWEGYGATCGGRLDQENPGVCESLG